MAILETAGDIITKFELYMDDTTELSFDEELDLLEQKYQEVSSEVDWESLKKAYSGTASGLTLSLPSRFSHLIENYSYSDANTEYANGPVIFVGSNYDPYQVVNWSDRRRYRDHSNIAYLDLPNNNLVFPVAPSSGAAVEFDYIEYPASIDSTDDVPWIPERFRSILFYLMCTDDTIIQQSEKALSYKNENEQRAEAVMNRMKMWNAKLIQM